MKNTEDQSFHSNQNIRKLDLKDLSIKSYLIYFPKNYNSEERFPTIIFLHGAGERGTNILDVKRTGLPQKLETDKDFPFIVISPQCPPLTYWQPDVLNVFSEEVLPLYKIDHTQLYLTGISMGGFGTWLWAINNPQKFAAIAPICGGGDPKNACNLKEVPVWAFHGAKDNIVPISATFTMVEALKKCGNEVIFTIYPDAYHDSWTETYNNPKLYHWFLQYRKGIN